MVLPLTEGTEGQWVGDCAEATPVLVPLLSLGRRVVATPVAGEPAGTVMIAPANVAAGGWALLSTRLSPAARGSYALLCGGGDAKGPKGSGGDEVGGAQGGAGLRVPLGGSEGAKY